MESHRIQFFSVTDVRHDICIGFTVWCYVSSVYAITVLAVTLRHCDETVKCVMILFSAQQARHSTCLSCLTPNNHFNTHLPDLCVQLPPKVFGTDFIAGFRWGLRRPSNTWPPTEQPFKYSLSTCLTVYVPPSDPPSVVGPGPHLLNLALSGMLHILSNAKPTVSAH